MLHSSSPTVTDLFCGAGGSTTGAIQAGATVKLAINHWQRAIETHHTNYPTVDHVLTDISQSDPRRYPATTILIASPECTNHSLSKGKKRKHLGQATLWEAEPALDPAEERSRCTMWDPLRFAEHHHYQAVILENVVDARHWCMWDAWLHAWQSLDYAFETVYFNSQFAHPTPQSRDRMYFIAWKRGNRKPDLTIRPLAYCVRCEKEVESLQCWKHPRKRYGKYQRQYVYCCPFCAAMVTPYYSAATSAIDWSLPAQRIGDRKNPLAEKTMKRLDDGLKKFASEPFLIDHIAEYRVRSIHQPLSTVVAGGNHQSLVTPVAWLMSYYNNGQLAQISKPVPTVTTHDRCALITQHEKNLCVQECRFRMLEPQEIQAAMAFPRDYVVTGSRREKVKQLGNAVTPPVMEVLMRRCLASLQ